MRIKITDPLHIFLFRLAVILIPGLVLVKLLKFIKPAYYTIVNSKIIYDFYKAIMISSEKLLHMIGFNTSLVFSKTMYYYPVYAIRIDNGNYVYMGITCLGILLMASFATLVIAYPGKWKHKLWVIPLGCFIIQLLNILRMSILTVLCSYYHMNIDRGVSFFGLLKLSHHDIFNLFVYVFILLMFIFYVNHYGTKKIEKSNTDRDFRTQPEDRQ
jgi:exosortase/archaeosortase family protein